MHKNSNKTNELNNKNKDINDIINQKMLAIIDVIQKKYLFQMKYLLNMNFRKLFFV